MEPKPSIHEMKNVLIRVSKLELDLDFVKSCLQVNDLIENVREGGTRKYTFVLVAVENNGDAVEQLYLSTKHFYVRFVFRSPPAGRKFGDITITNAKIEENAAGSQSKTAEHTVTADVMETVKPQGRRKKPSPKQHRMVMTFRSNRKFFSWIRCTECGENQECTAIPPFIYLFQRKNQAVEPEQNKENATPVRHTTKKRLIKRELCVSLQQLDLNNVPPMPAPVKSSPPSPPVALKKVVKQAGPIAPEQLEQANKLSMVQLIRDFEGTDSEQFLRFCTERMTKDGCESIPLLTIEQADTQLWHELRIGRITASRIREAARCTMLNGSLVQKIMGQSSGFSFAMKRGTDLEGHVLAELRKQYPGLRETGLILDSACPWMGASPDGICDEFVLEIKCPNTRNTHECYVDLDRLSPKYYSQIQLQMHMAHRTKALLAVAALDFEQTKGITQVWIEYNKEYVDDLMEQAYDFWCKAVFRALLRKRSGKK